MCGILCRGVTNFFFSDLRTELNNSMTTNFTAADFQNSFSGIILPPYIFENQTNESVGIVFGAYRSSRLFPLVNKTLDAFAVASTVVSATITRNILELLPPIYVVLQLEDKVCCFLCVS